MTRRVWLVVLTVFMCGVLANRADAQSAFAGVVKDISGGVLPGVLVEASSDVLIERVKAATTDEAGQYRIVDLRPGKYVVTFTLTGFQTVRQEDVELPTDFTRSINVELKIGAVSEALTVSGTAPVVDVQNAVRVTSIDRQAIDTLPLGNNIWEMAQMIPAIDMYSDTTHRASSVGGSYGAVQTYMSVNGYTSAQNVVMVDGMTVSGLETNGTVQAYFNNDMNSEVSYQTSGISADRSGGGVTVNMIPREGGNRFSGNGKFAYKPSDWIADNNTARIQAMGLTSKSSLRYLADETISQGGPIIRNSLWFFGSYHQFNTSDFIPNVFTDDGAQFAGDQRIRQGSIRLTYQAMPRLKLTGYYDKTQKLDGSQLDSFDDPETALYSQKSPNYVTGNVKATATLTSRLLVEGGYSMNREWRDQVSNEGRSFERGTPEWYANARRVGTGGAVNTLGAANIVKNWPSRDNLQGSLSYVTGGHQIKAGMQWQTGRFYHLNDTNGDLYQNYQVQAKASCPHSGICSNAELVPDANGFEWKLTSPTTITAWNTPVQSQDRLNADIGIFAQDSWRLRRLTINTGLRWEHINAQNDAYSTGEGRWVPTRSINGVYNVPDWYDWAPRFSTVWDVFGSSRTAVKYSLNRYNNSAATSLANSFNTLTITSRSLGWSDKNTNDIVDGAPGFIYNAAGQATGYNPDTFCTTAMFNDASNPCEVNMSPLLNAAGVMFGTPAAEQQYQGYPRGWTLEQIIEVQHALTSRLSITYSWTSGKFNDQQKTVNTLRRADDYTPFTIYNPIDGSPMTHYQIKDIDTQNRLNSPGANVTYVEPNIRSINQTHAIEFRMRPYAGAQIFGGFTMQRFESRDCDSSIPGFVVDPNSLRFCDDWNLATVDDHGVYDTLRNPGAFVQLGPLMYDGEREPFAKDFRVGVSLPLPWYGINLGVSYLNNDEGTETPNITVTVSNAGFNPATCGGGTTRYTDGLTGCSGGANDLVVVGTSNTRKIATGTAPACPTTYGCVPGTKVVPSDYRAGATATTFTRELVPGSFVRRERLNQFDFKLSKTFRVKSFSVLPTLEVANAFNQDKITGTVTNVYATTGGTYQVPNSVLQSRIIGVGAQVRW